MDYNLSGLSSRSFEKLVQALATQIIGPGVVVFGDGPDGGREATFEGAFPFPSPQDLWSGYWVFQAKFLQRPRNPASDAKWFLQQVELELKNYAARRRRRPDYYIIATNIVLTPVERRGSKDRLATLFRKFKDKVPLRGWHVWDYDQLTAYLDSFQDIRTAYAAWITSGDVLSAALTAAKLSRPDFSDVMANFLAKELLADQFANLDQAGHATEDKIPLSKVFVDLPATTYRCAEPPSEHSSPAPIPFIQHMAAIASERLDPTSLDELRGTRDAPPIGRYVLLGGPGQGKTTLAQFLCQLFRTSILRDRLKPRLSVETRNALTAIAAECTSLSIPVPAARRFPVRIVLSEYAKALSGSQADGLTVLSYLARQIRRRTDHGVTTDDLREWLRIYPWLLVLDGLDEVPASTNRAAVVDSVRDFLIDVAQLNADSLILATSRPQGYVDDFAREHYRHFWLAPLSQKQSLAYARRLVRVRYASEPERQEKVISRLTHAVREDATARLMRSPLLITIMATLVDQIGRPPQDRWRLFRDYYDVIYRREMERDIPAADLLRDHRSNLDTIHTRVGLVLQVASERSGGTEARLPLPQFGNIVAERLKEEGFAGAELITLRDRIIDAAANRLVFLVGVEEGLVGFEIRSLQEFMAAEALMAGTDDAIKGRLQSIAAATSWRNVFLFAAGRCFAAAQHLRETIVVIATELNDRLAGDLGRAVAAGSGLGIDLLEDGLARRAPRFARLFARIALDAVALSPSDLQVRLAAVCDADIEGLCEEALRTAIVGSLPSHRLGAWTTLLGLVDRYQWAADLASTNWPDSRDEQLLLLMLPSTPLAGKWLQSRPVDTAAAVSPHRSWRLWRLYERHKFAARPTTLVEAFWHIAARDRPPHHQSFIVRLPGAAPVWRASVPTLGASAAYTASVSIEGGCLHPAWTALREGVEFARTPTIERLARALDYCAEAASFYVAPAGSLLAPWVYAALVGSADEPADLRRAAEAVRGGKLGTLGDWRKAEARWRTAGITADDMLYEPTDGYAFDAAIATQGCPASVLRIETRSPGLSDDSEAIGRLFRRLPASSHWRRPVAELFVRSIVRDEAFALPGAVTPADMTTMLSLSRTLTYAEPLLVSIAALNDPEPWLSVLDALGRQPFLLSRGARSRLPGMERAAQYIADLVRQYPAQAGLARLCAFCATYLPHVELTALARGLSRQGPPAAASDRRAWVLAITVATLAAGYREVSGTELADLVVQADSYDNQLLTELLNNIERLEIYSTEVQEFLLALNARVAASALPEHEFIVDALVACLAHQKSTLNDLTAWTALQLPELLFGVAVEHSALSPT